MNSVFKGLATLAIFFASILHASKKSDEFIVGTTSGYAPYVSLNEKGNYEGFDIDFAHELAKKLHRKLVIKDLGSMPSLLLALKKNKIDAIIWAISITSERLKEMEMIYYQGEKVTELPLLFWKEIPPSITKIEDLGKDSKYSVCVEAGSYQDSVLQQYPSLKLRFLDKITDAIMELKFGKSTATATDHSLLSHLQTQHPELKVLRASLPADQHALGNGVCVRKEEKELADKIRRAIEELKQEGKIAELEKKWNMT